MHYAVFIDESGDHNLSSPDPQFPVFVLGGTIFNADGYIDFKNRCKELKDHFWGNQNIVLHSRDIRKWQNGFEILMDENVRADFYQRLNSLISESSYTIITSGIHKIEYLKSYHGLSNIYGSCLAFLLERVIFYTDRVGDAESLMVIAEKRGKGEDKELQRYFNTLVDTGTPYVESRRFKALGTRLLFRSKAPNEVGLQLSDLISYPVAKHILSPESPNPAFDILHPKIDQHHGKVYGIKVFK